MNDIAIITLPKLLLRGPLLSLGQLHGVLDKEGVSSWIDDMQITTDVNGDWVYKDNNFETRLDRWLRLREHLNNLGYKVYPDRHSNQIKQYKEKLAEIRKKKIAPMSKSYIENYGYKNVLTNKPKRR